MIEITKERRYCNCCHGSDRVETITFWSNDKWGLSGTSVALCRACRLSLRVELEKEVLKEMRHNACDL